MPSIAAMYSSRTWSILGWVRPMLPSLRSQIVTSKPQ